MTINTRNQVTVGLAALSLVILGSISYWLIRTETSLDSMAVFSIMSAVGLALLIFSAIFVIFPKTNAPELLLLLGYATGLMLQFIRFSLVYPIFLNDQTLQTFSIHMAVFGYFLALSTLLLMVIVEMNALLLRMEDVLLYFSIALYILIFLQPLSTMEVSKGYILYFSDSFVPVLLKVVFEGLILSVCTVLFFSKKDPHSSYFAIAIIILGLGLHMFAIVGNFIFVSIGIALQLVGLVLLFFLIKRRYLWFRWT